MIPYFPKMAHSLSHIKFSKYPCNRNAQKFNDTVCHLQSYKHFTDKTSTFRDFSLKPYCAHFVVVRKIYIP